MNDFRIVVFGIEVSRADFYEQRARDSRGQCLPERMKPLGSAWAEKLSLPPESGWGVFRQKAKRKGWLHFNDQEYDYAVFGVAVPQSSGSGRYGILELGDGYSRGADFARLGAELGILDAIGPALYEDRRAHLYLV